MITHNQLLGHILMCSFLYHPRDKRTRFLIGSFKHFSSMYMKPVCRQPWAQLFLDKRNRKN